MKCTKEIMKHTTTSVLIMVSVNSANEILLLVLLLTTNWNAELKTRKNIKNELPSKVTQVNEEKEEWTLITNL